ncbi:Choline-sulfatase [Planctomycetes bacterium Pan216]|uniref:Choline-sulfatase n=1 Tax=Kolteria novifilia TaxID=2527975 RepID=A0A518AXH3_9BACT|nr:Choline-sulfatase [Planctomycetes bacterium Pan216]
MNRRGAMLILITLGLLSTRALQAADGPGRPPNIVFILIDDMGYGDLSLTGNERVQTRSLDRLVREGLLLTQFYVASPICSPSRVAFTTGQYPARHLIHSYLASRKRNRDRGMRDFLDPRAPSLARTLQQAGYATAHFGKWHMGGGRDVGNAPLPQAYGFDESLTSFEGLGDRVLPPGGLSEESALLGRGTIRRAPKHQLTEIYVDRAIDFVENHRDRPFYLQLWLNDVHDSHRPSKEALARVASSDHPLHQRFHAVLDEMDRQLGRLVRAIDDAGLGEETLILVTSDNGPTAWPRYYKEGGEPPGSTAGFRGRKWSLYEGGIRMPLIARWKGTIPAGQVDDQTIMTAVDFLPTLASISNADPNSDSDGVDVSSALLGSPRERRPAIFWEYGRDGQYLRPGAEPDRSPNLAMRDGRWKFLVNEDGTRPELYDLARDEREQRNLAGEKPELVDRYSKKLLGWRCSLPSLDASKP